MEILVKDPLTFLPTVYVTTLPVEETYSVSDETRLTDLLFERSEYDAGYNNYQVNVLPKKEADTWVFENADPSVCALTEEGLATWVGDGTAKVAIVGGGGRQNVRLSFATSETVTYVWKGFTGTSVSSVLSNTIKDMMVDGGDFCVFNTGYTENAATLNPNRWFKPNLSAGGLATTIFGGWTAANSGVLIAPRTFIGVRHWDNNAPYNLTPGCKIRFVNHLTSVVYERTVLARYNPPGYDLYVCILDDVAMPGITPAPIVGNWFVEALSADQNRLCGMGFQVHIDKRVTPCVFDPIVNGGAFPTFYATGGITRSISWLKRKSQFADPSSWLHGFDDFWAEDGAINYGDSGGWIGTVSQGVACVVSLFVGPESGALFYEGIEDEMNAWIQSSATIAGVTITDTVTIAPSPI